MNLRSSEQRSEHFSEKLIEIDYKLVCKKEPQVNQRRTLFASHVCFCHGITHAAAIKS